MKGGRHKKYCTDYGYKIYCKNNSGIDERTKFIFNKNSDDTYSFKSAKTDKYCRDLAWTIKCDKTNIGDWEKFKINKNNNGTYSLMGNGGKGKTANGELIWKYCADEGHTIRCNRGGIGDWEKFDIGKA